MTGAADPTDPDAAIAHRRELRAVARGPRLAGFVIVIVAAGMIIAARSTEAEPAWLLNAGYVGLGIGWIVLGAAFVQRKLYHRRRARAEE